jgi:hypothetical protein
MRPTWYLLLLLAVVGLGAYATIPTGPSVMGLSGLGQPFEQFQTAGAVCWSWASVQAATAPGQAATEVGLSSGAIGTASDNPGLGAAIGAGREALGGTCVGLGASQAATGTVRGKGIICVEALSRAPWVGKP